MVRAAIVVDGRGGLPEEICRQLRQAGASRVQGGPYAADAAEAHLGLRPRELPSIVVFVRPKTLTIDTTAPWQRVGVPHLPVLCDGRAAVVGPLIVPGRGACWRCHALTSHDLDAVGALPVGRFTLDTVALPEGGLGILTAAVAASVALAAAAGATRLTGVSTELELEGPSVVHRFWPRHPLCSECVGSGSGPWPTGGHDTMAG
ncbi:hypothetical protein [Knoellia subterranea]|uniref:Bacteriocin biosynthesis cyclodehydratase domain-containing protein n=1 Tax=Knoellia subterranea KCTC 19937 TaxID=1385521 RepID=A0A0A0JR03_9MICO|nr:hypothetical protein [Knoellia subterranea]KGN39618.1 hypothetical protein N803_02650 [Knoellia subterranea KCTC 19937]